MKFRTSLPFLCLFTCFFCSSLTAQSILHVYETNRLGLASFADIAAGDVWGFSERYTPIV